MARMSDEDKLRRRIAAGAGIADVERLLAILKAKEASQGSMRRSATVRLPRCWRRLSETDFESANYHVLDEHEPHFGVGDPRPRRDDEREVHTRFPDGRMCTLTLASGENNYFVSFAVFDEEGDKNPIYEQMDGVDLSGDKVEFEVEGQGFPSRQRDIANYVLHVEWVPDAMPYEFVRVEYDPSYAGGDYADVGDFAWVPFDPWFAPDDHDRCRDIVLGSFESTYGLPRSCVIAMDLDATYVRSGEHFVEHGFRR